MVCNNFDTIFESTHPDNDLSLLIMGFENENEGEGEGEGEGKGKGS